MNTLKPAAYIVGMDLNGLAVLRSLAHHVERIVCIDNDVHAIGMKSRYGIKRVAPILSGLEFIEYLINTGKAEKERPVLFLTQESSVLAVSQYREKIQSHFRITLPGPGVLEALMNKDEFHRLAAMYDAPLPKSVTLNDGADLESLNALEYPCVLKPSYKDYTYGSKFKKAYVVRSATEAVNLYAEIKKVMPQVVVQEWIEGDDDDIYFCLQYRSNTNSALRSFVGRKIRSWPPKVGGTASCIMAEAYISDAIQLTDDFFRKTQFQGMGGIEYKLDARHKKLRMIEPTVGRTDMQHEVAVLNGCNLVLVQYLSEAGLPQLPADIHRPVRVFVWRDYVADAWSAQTTGVENIRSRPNVRIADAHFRWTDPGPTFSLRHLVERVKCAMWKILPAKNK